MTDPSTRGRATFRMRPRVQQRPGTAGQQQQNQAEQARGRTRDSDATGHDNRISLATGIRKLRSPAAEAVSYIRPHEIEIVRTPDERPSIPAIFLSSNAAGPVARIELIRDDGELAEVTLPRDRSDELALNSSERVFLVPRRFRVFLDPTAERAS